jgi:hypothetical protein
MSYAALRWAFSFKVPKATDKLLLVALANYADAEGVCFPSQAALVDITELDKKTIPAGLKRLVGMGAIAEIGRVGSTGQVRKYQLGCAAPEAAKQPENGEVIENQSPPFFPLKPPVFPPKAPRFSPESPPKTGHVTSKEPVTEPVTEPVKEARASRTRPAKPDRLAFPLPSWLPADAWTDFRDHRRQIKRPLTVRAEELLIAKLDGFRREGHNVVAILNESIIHGWQGIFPPRNSAAPQRAPERMPAQFDPTRMVRYDGVTT